MLGQEDTSHHLATLQFKKKKSSFMKTHAFNNLPEPRKTFSDDLSKLFVSFLWDGGKKRE